MPISPEQRKAAKKAIKEVEFGMNPQKAVHSELAEQTDHLEGIKEGLEAIKMPISKGSSAGDFLEMFLKSIKGDKGEQGEKGEDAITPKKGVDYYTPEEVQKLSTDILRLSTPKKGEDYFTEEEKQEIIDESAAISTERARPVKGVDYFDGVDGKTPIKGVDYFDGRDGAPGKDAVLPEVEVFTTAVVDKIRKEKKLFVSDLYDGGSFKYNKKDQRWHGGGGGGGTESPLTTKGDLYTYTTENARLGVGTNGQILSADSTQATGLKWIAPPATGLTVGTTTITSGTTTRILYDNAGVLGEYTISGTGTSVAMATGPTITGGTLTTSTVNSVTLTTGGSATTFLNGTGAYSTPSGASITAPGSDTQVIFNDGGVFGADAGLTYVKATDTLTAGVVNVPTGGSFTYNSQNAVRAQTALNNWYFGNSGNLTASGTLNTAGGYLALNAINGGAGNTVFGASAGLSVIGGTGNSAFGYLSGASVTSGNYNTTVGFYSYINGTGSYNVSIGQSSLGQAGSGTYNTAVGTNAMPSGAPSQYTTSIGASSLPNVTSGDYNTVLGYNTGGGITTGDKNTIIGAQVTGLTSTLANNIIIADGDGNKRIVVDSAGTVGIGSGLGTTIAGTAKALVVNNGTSTGNIFEAQDNGTAVFTVADGGLVTANNSSLGFRTGGAGSYYFTTASVPTANRLLTINAGDTADTIPTLGQAQVWTGRQTFLGGGLIPGNQYFFLNGVSNNSGALPGWDTGQTVDTQMWRLGETSNAVVLIKSSNIVFDYAHAIQTNPTVFIHSANQSTSQWLGLTHDGTNGVIQSGTGATSIVAPAGGSQKALITNNSTSTGNIFEAQDNGTAVFTVADGGNTYLGLPAGIASPVSRSIIGEPGLGTDKTGGSVTLSGGPGTGTGIAGDVVFQTAKVLTTGTTLQTLGDRDRILAKYTTLTESTDTAFARIAVATGTVTGGVIVYTVESNDATDYQGLSGMASFTIVNKAGTLTLNLGTDMQSNANSSGTLTGTLTLVDSTGGNADFKMNAVSSLTQTVLRINARVIKQFGTGSISAQ